VAPTLFNTYIIDQPILDQVDIKHFIHPDDTAKSAQSDNFQGIERALEKSLRVMFDNYSEKSLEPNLVNTQFCIIHLKTGTPET